MTELLSTLIPVIGRALLDFLWQGAVIGLLAGVALSLMGSARPQSRYAVGCLALLACALAPVVECIVLLAGTSASPMLAGVHGVVGHAPFVTLGALPDVATWPASFDSRLPLVVALWSAGASVLLLRNAAGVAWIATLRAAAQDTQTGQQWQRRLDALAAHFELVRAPVLRLVDRLDSPASAGWLRPVVLLPVALVLRMPVDQLDALLAHELAHIRRNDYLVNLLQSVVEALLFYHPAVWWLSREIRRERECIADRLAADVTGSPRTLAIALSALSEWSDAHCPSPQFAQAAHGGHLMSRIEHLIRPDRRAASGRFVFPVVGIAAVCIAFIAHAQVTTHPAVTSTPTTVVTTRADAHKATERVFALVRADDSTGMTMSGPVSDIPAIRAVRQHIKSDFLWFKRDGKAYVVTDPALLARARDAWRDADALDPQMEALDRQMEVHDAAMEKLDSRMEALSASREETPAMREASRRMEALDAQQEALDKQQEQLERAQVNADDATRDKLDADVDALSRRMDALSAQMDEQSRIMDAESAKMDRNQAPIEALDRQMEEARKPMEALDARMDAMDKRMDALSDQATRETSAIIDEAIARQLATPAP
jgi:beta-lactamase regulating signal transducer with metallopeptidase domain